LAVLFIYLFICLVLPTTTAESGVHLVDKLSNRQLPGLQGQMEATGIRHRWTEL